MNDMRKLMESVDSLFEEQGHIMDAVQSLAELIHQNLIDELSPAGKRAHTDSIVALDVDPRELPSEYGDPRRDRDIREAIEELERLFSDIEIEVVESGIDSVPYTLEYDDNIVNTIQSLAMFIDKQLIDELSPAGKRAHTDSIVSLDVDPRELQFGDDNESSGHEDPRRDYEIQDSREKLEKLFDEVEDIAASIY